LMSFPVPGPTTLEILTVEGPEPQLPGELSPVHKIPIVPEGVSLKAKPRPNVVSPSVVSHSAQIGAEAPAINPTTTDAKNRRKSRLDEQVLIRWSFLPFRL